MKGELAFDWDAVLQHKDRAIQVNSKGVEYLLRNAGRVLTRDQLIDRIWGSDYVGDTKTLDVHVRRLRAKIELEPAAPRHLLTVRGLGYKFEA